MVQIRDEAGEPAVASQGEDLEVRIARELLERAKSGGVSLAGTTVPAFRITASHTRSF